MSATVSLIQMLAAGFANTDGTPAASAKCRFYQPATLTPVTVYADTQAAGAITPPLILSAGGTGTAYTQQPTRLIIKDATDTNTLFDGNVNTTRAESDYIQSAAINGGTETRLQTVLDAWSTAFGGSAGLWKFKQASNATERNMTSVIADLGISVKSFGAVGNGVTDDTAAMQATITYVQSLGGGVVVIPGGTFLTSAELSVSASDVAIIGAGTVTIIKQTNATANGITFRGPSGLSTNIVSDLVVQHATSSTGNAIEVIGSNTLYVDRVNSNGTFRVALKSAGVAFVNSSQLSGDFANAAAAGFSGADLRASNSIFAGYTGALVSSASFRSTNSTFSAATGHALTSTSGTLIQLGTGNVYSGGGGAGHGVSIAATVQEVDYGSGNSITPDILDSRTATTAPVGYTFALNGNFTPLPLQASSIRANGTAAGITITVNAIAATGNGLTWRLYCINTSGAGVTWAFAAQYKLAGGAVPNPATGNMIIMTFEYDPISTVTREVCRSGVVAI